MDTQRLPKKEEEEDEESYHQLSSNFESINAFSLDQQNHSMNDFEGIFDVTMDSLSCSHEISWDFWEEEKDEEENEEELEGKRLSSDQEGSSFGFWDNMPTEYEDKELGLKLNLNHQEVIDAWSDRQQQSLALYGGEVPVMEEEKNMRREASVLRYKEKRQNRLFSKKIRYQVRKLNADKRPRFKGRFVKRDT